MLGRALEVACGLGRNALHLGMLGFEVDALDASPVAVEHVAAIARSEGLTVRARVLDVTREPLPDGPYEVVVQTYFLERELFASLERIVAPGGLLIAEAFLADPGASYGPHDPAHVLEPGELRTAWPGLEPLDYREGRPDPASRPVASLVARRPDS